MKKRVLFAILAMLLTVGMLLSACSADTGSETPETAEETAAAADQTAGAAAQSEEAAQTGIEEEDCPAYSTVSDFAAAVQAFTEDAGHTFTASSSGEKSSMYEIDADTDAELIVLRIYVNENDPELIDHFFVKFSYSWADSDEDFAFVLRFLKFCTKSAVAGMTNEQYGAVCDAVGLGDTEEMIAYSTGSAEFADDAEWTLTKNTGTLKTMDYEDAGGAYQLGFYNMNDEDEPNDFVFTVTPAAR